MKLRTVISYSPSNVKFDATIVQTSDSSLFCEDTKYLTNDAKVFVNLFSVHIPQIRRSTRCRFYDLGNAVSPIAIRHLSMDDLLMHPTSHG